jgi:hypothetical protein
MNKIDYYSELSQYLKQHDLEKANRVVMNEIGNLFVKKREDFIFLLQNSGISANDNLTDGELIDLFLANIHDNKKLLLGIAFFISHNNKVQNFDGDSEHNESGIKATTKVLYNYFDSGNYDNFNSIEEEEETSNVVGAIAGAIGGLANLGSGIIAGQNKKKYGVTDLIAKKQEAKTQMVQQILAQRQAQQAAAQQKEKEQQKQKKIIIIGAGVLLLSAIIGTVIYFKNSKK